MANWPNFRVKVDLTKYHRDVRRFSWIFVDSTNCRLISHVKQRIVNIFGIQEPFNLLLNDNEYLPPTEDVRVLKENETIAVVPELKLNNDDDFELSIRSPIVHNDCIQSAHPEHQEVAKVNGRKENCGDSSIGDISNTEGTMCGMSEVTEIESASDSKGTGDNAIENSETLDICEKPLRKRKRIRRKKSKKEPETTFSEDVVEKLPTRSCRPKIVQSYVLPAGKHIRFDNGENNRFTVIENTTDNRSRETPKVYQSDLPVPKDSTIVDNLSTLLALRKSSTPLTFGGKKVNQRIGNAVLIEERKTSSGATDFSGSFPDIRRTINEESNGHRHAVETTREQIDYSQVNFEKYPILESLPELNDTIAFKILRIGKDYSPEISDHIVAKTRDWSPKTLLFTFEILRGQEQIQTPMGKFALPEDDSENQEEIDTANFNFSQLIEPRLLYRH